MPFPRTPPAGKSHLGLAWHCVRRGRAGVGAEQDCIELAVELGEPLVLALQLLHSLLVLDLPLLVRDLPILEFDLSPIELDLSQLVVDNGSPVEHRQATAEPGQRGVVLRFADRGRRRR
jgi:hypothetical protein